MFSVFLLVAISIGIMFLFNNATNINVIKIRMQLTEIAKPSIVRHSEVVSSTKLMDYPKPALTVNDKILRDLNCPLSEQGLRYCDGTRDQGQSESQGCFAIYTPNSLVGGLQPAYPIAECLVGDGRYVHQSGCMTTEGTAFVIERQAKYEKIDSLSKLKSIYAPIESETEALSYAIAATGYSARYGTETLKDTEYFVEQLENTHVEVHGNEYTVRLFDYSLCGCGKHETIAIDVAVNRQGEIREIYREAVYRDTIKACID